MDEKVKIQISFASHGPNLGYVKQQLKQLAENENYEFYCAFLTRRQLKSAKMDNEIGDILTSTLGGRLTYLADKYKTRDEALENISSIREELNNICDYHYVLGLVVSPGLQEEVKLSSNGKVILYI